jgi:hypothetical protein
MKDKKSLCAISKVATIAIVALVIVASVFATYSYLNANSGLTRTVLVTTTLTNIATTTAVTTIASMLTSNVATSRNRSSQLYDLTFNQTGTCANPETYEAPWAVVLNNKTTSSQPPNSEVPAFASTWRRQPNYSIYSMIVFQVPTGQYNYSVYPLNVFLSQSGSVTIKNSNEIIHVQDTADGCTA